eukprot:CAMPEP_0172373720 /NCGR_PEP_ID=MMETSP1060-20121228/52951_1 /TAXON_ID=37318 /ORGANISM="Pseudo-nitzschia pungens, Strain cf. cingulata" /LENGTH=251 /DNA_ID=CAMNT_0013100135 /DNA_START=77 /DNA_END=829 /DNA_ORIENTATION=-
MIEDNINDNIVDEELDSTKCNRKSWIPSEVEIPVIVPSIRDEENTGLSYHISGNYSISSLQQTMHPKPRPIVLVVVGVRMESKRSYWMVDCPAILREDFPDFPKRLNDTLELCRKCPHSRIIHLHAVHPQRRQHSLRYYNARNNDLNMTATNNISLDNKIPVDWNNEDAKELLIPDPSWSAAGQHRLREALRRFATVGDEPPLVLVCGLVTSVCVRTASEVACSEGCETLVLEDTCADWGRDPHDSVLGEW